MSFGFHKITKPKQRWEAFGWKEIRLVVFGIFVMILGRNIITMMSYAASTQQTLLENGSLQDIAAQVRGFNPELSRGLTAIDRIINNQKNKSVSKYTLQDRESLRTLLLHHSDVLPQLLGGGSTELLKTLSRFANFSADRKSLLGFERPQTYLIVLQNTAEKRPNGGFFGSFVKLVIDRGVVASFDIIDSYVPQVLQPDTFIIGPEWINNFLPEREIFFVGANKIGFSYQDGANIQKLYERAYIGEKVRGVVFLRTDLLTKILPSLQEKLWEWQFANASIDLIRGEARSGKKELYVRDSLGFLQASGPELVKGFLSQADLLLADHYLNIYVSDISGPLHSVLREGNLTTRFEEDHMYFWDSNISYNKIDQFIEKTIRFYNNQGDLVKTTSQDIVSIADLQPGIYRITIQYRMQVPDFYEKLILGLQQKYGITLGEREYHILGLSHERSTRGVVYVSKNIEVKNLTGNIYHQAFFETPFSHNVYYKTKIKGNGLTNVVEMEISIGNKK